MLILLMGITRVGRRSSIFNDRSYFRWWTIAAAVWRHRAGSRNVGHTSSIGGRWQDITGRRAVVGVGDTGLWWWGLLWG